MKKIFVSAVVISAMFLTSCGGSEVCDCSDMALDMAKEMKAIDGDMDKITEISEKYKGDMEKCEKLADGKSDEEMKAMEEEMKGCPSAKELEEMMAKELEEMMEM